VYTGVLSVQFKPGRVEEAARIYQDSVVPELRQMRGFEGRPISGRSINGFHRFCGSRKSIHSRRAADSFVAGGRDALICFPNATHP
jgi:hypothetical protein